LGTGRATHRSMQNNPADRPKKDVPPPTRSKRPEADAQSSVDSAEQARINEKKALETGEESPT